MYKDNLFQGEVKFLTGGNALNAMSPRALRLNGWDPHTDGIVRMRETQDTLCILYCALESCDSEVFISVRNMDLMRSTEKSICSRSLKDMGAGFFY